MLRPQVHVAAAFMSGQNPKVRQAGPHIRA